MTSSSKQIIKKDLYRYGGQTSILKALLAPRFGYTGFRFTYFLRKASNYKKMSPMGLFYGLILYHLGYKYGFQIPVTTQIGEGLYIGHFGTIVINKKAKIGKNCNIAHGITIGQIGIGNKKGCPTIGNKVWIGTGAVIVGNIKIGDNVLIAPNSFVNGDVPSNSLVIGNPAQIIEKENPTEGYIDYVVD